jgi:hypothetical protein
LQANSLRIGAGNLFERTGNQFGLRGKVSSSTAIISHH